MTTRTRSSSEAGRNFGKHKINFINCRCHFVICNMVIIIAKILYLLTCTSIKHCPSANLVYKHLCKQCCRIADVHSTCVIYNPRLQPIVLLEGSLRISNVASLLLDLVEDWQFTRKHEFLKSDERWISFVIIHRTHCALSQTVDAGF